MCLCFFSLTDLFLCTSETQETVTTKGVSIFSGDKEILLKHGKHDLTHSSKAAPGPRKTLKNVVNLQFVSEVRLEIVRRSVRVVKFI